MEADILVVIGAGEKVKRVVFHAEVMVGMNVVHAEGMVENNVIGAGVQEYMLILNVIVVGDEDIRIAVHVQGMDMTLVECALEKAIKNALIALAWDMMIARNAVEMGDIT